MKSAGLVTANTSIAFHGWTIDTGPLVESNQEIWDEIAAALAKGKVTLRNENIQDNRFEVFPPKVSPFVVMDCLIDLPTAQHFVHRCSLSSRYTHPVAISNTQLVSLDERGVTFR